METRSLPLPVPGNHVCIWIQHEHVPFFPSTSQSLFVFLSLPQSNALPSHVKITVSRQTLFEDSFQQVRVFHLSPCVNSACSLCLSAITSSTLPPRNATLLRFTVSGRGLNTFLSCNYLGSFVFSR